LTIKNLYNWEWSGASTDLGSWSSIGCSNQASSKNSIRKHLEGKAMFEYRLKREFWGEKVYLIDGRE
jgi:hypothetical protein